MSSFLRDSPGPESVHWTRELRVLPVLEKLGQVRVVDAWNVCPVFRVFTHDPIVILHERVLVVSLVVYNANITIRFQYPYELS